MLPSVPVVNADNVMVDPQAAGVGDTLRVVVVL
jgi:hypothetical protein